MPKIYHELMDFNYRVESTSLVINNLLDKQWVDKNKIVVVGFSEGAHIAPKVAIQNPKVSHLACFVGAGLSQVYDPIFNLLNEEKYSSHHSDELLTEINEYMQILQDINKDPKSTTKFWRAHTYKMWSGIFENPPLKHFKTLNIPIYFALATKDKKSPLEGTITVPIEFARLGKKNLTLEICKNCDHGFTEIQVNNKSTSFSRFEEYISSFIQWLNNQ